MLNPGLQIDYTRIAISKGLGTVSREKGTERERESERERKGSAKRAPCIDSKSQEKSRAEQGWSIPQGRSISTALPSGGIPPRYQGYLDPIDVSLLGHDSLRAKAWQTFLAVGINHV